MKKRVLSILLCIMMLCGLLPTAALATESTATLQYINVTETEPWYGFSSQKDNTTMGVYISGSGAYDVTEDFSGYTTIINGAAVTIDEGGAVKTEDVYIFGEGSLTVGGVTFTSGHDIAIASGTVDAVWAAVQASGSDAVNISGTVAAETELVVYHATVASEQTLTFAGANSQITISGGGSLTVEEGATVTPAQDARITALAGATVSGITLYDANTTDALSENGSYTVTTEDVDENYAENFIWLDADDNGEPIRQWVQMVDESSESDPNAPQNNEYWFEYDWRDSAAVVLGKESVPSRWDEESYMNPINFYAEAEADTYAPISFTLTPPQDNGEYSPVVEAEIFDWTEEKQYNTITRLDANNGTYTYTPTSDCGFIVRVWWTAEEYNYDIFGPGEGEIAVEINIAGSESATVTCDTLSSVANDKKISVGTKTKYILAESVESITLLITPGDNEQIVDIIVGWASQSFTANEEGTVNYTWDISDESCRYFEAVFGGTGSGEDGGGEGEGEGDEGGGSSIPENAYEVSIPGNANLVQGSTDTISVTVDLGDEQVAVQIQIAGATVYDHDGGCTVYVPKETPTDVTFTVYENYDSTKMQITLTDGKYFYERLELDEKSATNITAFADSNSVTIPDEVTFAVTPKDGSWYTVSWAGGNVTVVNGTVYAERVHVAANGDEPAKTYTVYESEKDEEKNIYYIGDTIERPVEGGEEADNALLAKYGLIFTGQTDLFIKTDFVGVSIDYKFIPDYGYQVTDVRDGESLLDVFDPKVDVISSFSYAVYKNRNIHFVVEFTPTEDSINITAANVGGAAIENGANAAESGTLALTVADTTTNSSIENAVGTFNITLDNVVSKGGDNGNWTTNITEFDDPITVSLTLDTESFTAENYTVYREHDGETVELTATYNPETGELTFQTNKFSEYTIVKKTSGGNGSSVVVPPVSTPTVEDVEIPIAGEDDAIQVGASVTGDKAVIDEVDLSELNNVIGDHVEGVGTVTIDFSGLKQDVDTVEIPADVVKEIADAVNDPANDAESLEIVLGSGVSIEFDAAALKEKAAQADGAEITISIESHEDADLTDAQKEAVGSRPAYDITVTSGGKAISDIGGRITVGAPYELKNNEKENGLVVWYVDNEGNRERCKGSYDPLKKRMTWQTGHLSLYMIDYCPSATFADLDIDAWYVDATDFVIEAGLMNGVSGSQFNPNGSATRAQVVAILWRLEGMPAANCTTDFSDVSEGKWYTDAIRWAASEGIVGGYGNGRFGPNDAITREQMAAILYRYEQYKGGGFTGTWMFLLDYSDRADISDWAYEAVCWMSMNGIVEGKSNNRLDPKGNATRAQTAAIIWRFCENEK